LSVVTFGKLHLHYGISQENPITSLLQASHQGVANHSLMTVTAVLPTISSIRSDLSDYLGINANNIAQQPGA
jgi:hypothetical protein